MPKRMLWSEKPITAEADRGDLVLDVEIDITHLAGEWPPGSEDHIRRAALAALRATAEEIEGLERIGLSMALADDETVQNLNRDYRGKDAPTNVLSFPSGLLEEEAIPVPAGEAIPLGDVIFALQTVCREADADKKSVHDHLCHLAVHGVLHLLGHDHMEDSEAEEMEAREREILGGLGIADPYAGLVGDA